MSADDKDRDSAKLKEAASLLTKGGTLIDEPCDLCNGVQVRFRNKVTCINCGNEKNQFEKADVGQREEQQLQQVHLREGSRTSYSSDGEGTKSLNKHLRRRSGRDVPSSRQGIPEMEPDIQEHDEYNNNNRKKEIPDEQGSLKRATLLLIDKITREFTRIKEEEYDLETLRLEAKKISILLKLLKKAKEVERF
ncbi:MAG TPA: Sjogren's syndrome/scleroderma autoantigen 1 family protein [Nitrososphaeraceae archaeon]